MDLNDFDRLSALARRDRPPTLDVAGAVVGRLRTAPPGRRTVETSPRRGLTFALVSASAAAASVLGWMGYQALAAIEQVPAGWLDPLSLWAGL